MKKPWNSIIEYGSYSIIAMCYIFGCQKNENIKTAEVKPEVTIVDSRAPLIHLHSDTVYTLGQLTRKQNEEMIIDAGTVIRALNGGGLQIEPGAIIRAEGTKENPIVFTSNDYTGNQLQNWNGITITGKAKNNQAGNTGDSTDFSGVLKYIRIEFASLTLNAVGNKTQVENVMVSYTNTTQVGNAKPKSAFNFLGGSVNVKNLISYSNAGPADFYITNGYNGKMQHLVSLRNPLFGETGDEPYNALAGVFIENNSGGNVSAAPLTFPIISNLSIIGPNNINGSTAAYGDLVSGLRSAGIVVSGGAHFFIGNSFFMGFPGAAIYVDDGATAANLELKNAVIVNSVFQAQDSSRTFRLQEAVYPPYNSYNLQDFLLNRGWNNEKYLSFEEFKLVDPFNYDQPNLLPSPAAEILSGADFTGTILNDPFFTKVAYRGGIGDNNWLAGWSNFNPLHTNYNFPQ